MGSAGFRVFKGTQRLGTTMALANSKPQSQQGSALPAENVENLTAFAFLTGVSDVAWGSTLALP